MKVSEILWIAANEELPEMTGEVDFGYSCDAIGRVTQSQLALWRKTMGFMQSLGCPVYSCEAFREFPPGERQGARYAWLMFASLYAEEIERKGEL